jgi:hypothetical protein
MLAAMILAVNHQCIERASGLSPCPSLPEKVGSSKVVRSGTVRYALARAAARIGDTTGQVRELALCRVAAKRSLGGDPAWT